MTSKKKYYIDLYVLFQTLGEVEIARDNKSVMPEMLIDLPWLTIERAMTGAAREFIASQNPA